MRILSSLILSVVLLSAPLTLTTGCKSTPQQIAYKSTASLVHSVDVAMSGWADYVVAERQRIASLSPGDRLGASSDLLRREGNVLNAYAKYQAYMRSASHLVHDGQFSPDIVSAAATLLEIIKASKK